MQIFLFRNIYYQEVSNLDKDFKLECLRFKQVWWYKQERKIDCERDPEKTENLLTDGTWGSQDKDGIKSWLRF